MSRTIFAASLQLLSLAYWIAEASLPRAQFVTGSFFASALPGAGATVAVGVVLLAICERAGALVAGAGGGGAGAAAGAFAVGARPASADGPAAPPVAAATPASFAATMRSASCGVGAAAPCAGSNAFSVAVMLGVAPGASLLANSSPPFLMWTTPATLTTTTSIAAAAIAGCAKNERLSLANQPSLCSRPSVMRARTGTRRWAS